MTTVAQLLRRAPATTLVLHHLHPISTTYPQVQHAHADLLKSGLSHDTHLATKLLSLYSSLRRFPDASLLLDSIPNPDPLCFSNLISSLSASQHPASAIALFRAMLSVGVAPDHFVLPSVLKACAAAASTRTGRQVHGLVSVFGFLSDSFVQSSLVHMYLKCGEVGDARRMFDGMTELNVVSWSTMVAGYARRGCVDEALVLLGRMRQSGVEPNLVTWNGLISGFSNNGCSMEAVVALKRMWADGTSPDKVTISSVLPAIGDLEDIAVGTQIHGHVMKRGYQCDSCVTSALIDMYGKCQHSEEMVHVFKEMHLTDVGSCNALISGLSRNSLVDDALKMFREFVGQGVELNVISWTSIIACCAQNGQDIEALELFAEMQVAGINPNSVTIPCLLPACANIAALMNGKSVHCFCFRNWIAKDVYVGSALVDMYAKCGRLGDARRVFDMMPSRNIVSWNAMMGGYAMHGKASDVNKLFLLMQSSEQKPDFITFGCILSACSQTGLTEEGLHYFESMQRDYGIVARTEHYACIISLLGRAGKLKEAYTMMKQIPFEPDACIWGALLSSCRVYGNVILGEIAAEKLFKLEPTNVGNYILLSNIYAAKGMNNEVDRIREMMKSRGLRKNPGCSWIELKNKVHILLAGDNSHPQMSQIAERLEILGREMKKVGFLPRTALVLQDVEEQDKEHILCGHSEKLAVVIGLLNTKPGTSLRIIKNLRICGDCHNAIKFISSFERREILVRDTNRFHHFKDGICSCGDYW